MSKSVGERDICERVDKRMYVAGYQRVWVRVRVSLDVAMPWMPWDTRRGEGGGLERCRDEKW